MSLPTTTLSTTVGPSDLTVVLGAVTSVTAIGMWLFLDGEAMQVTALPNTISKTVKVVRGVGGSRSLSHASGVTVYIGLSSQFYTQDPEGKPATIPAVLPWINVINGNVWTVVNGAWALTGGSTGDLVTGPSSSTDGNLTSFSGTTGTIVQDSGIASSTLSTALTRLGNAVGGTVALTPASTGAITVIAALTANATVLITVTVTTIFANGDGAQPTFSIGQTGALTGFAPTSDFTGAAARKTFSYGGTLTAGNALLVTATAGTGTTETGSMTVSAIAIPA